MTLIEPHIPFWYSLALVLTPLVIFGLLTAFVRQFTDEHFGKGMAIVFPLTAIFMGIIIWDTEDFRGQVYELIDETPCQQLPQLADDYSRHKSRVIDEVVLRCLIASEDPVLAQFLLESRS